MFYHFPKNLDRSITFYSVTLKNTQTESQKNIIFFQRNKKYLESEDKIEENKNNFLEIKFYFFPTFQKITVGGFVNQLIKKFWPKENQQIHVATSWLRINTFMIDFY